jgi:hypothetical protein
MTPLLISSALNNGRPSKLSNSRKIKDQLN